MPDDPYLGFEDPADPGFKAARGAGGGAGGRLPGIVSPPPGVVGGGYGSFFGSPTAGSTTFSSAPQRRVNYGGISGFRPWMALPEDSSLAGSGDYGQLMELLAQLYPQHFAYGGFVQPPGVRRPGMGVPGRGGAPTPAPAPNPAGESLPQTMPMGALTPQQQGSWGWDPQNVPGYMNIGDSPLYRRLTDLLGQYGAAGTFSPTGSPAVMNAVKENALGAADAARKRAGTLAVLSGADPASRANYMLQTDLNAQGDVARASNDAVLGQLLGQQQFGQSLFGTGLSANMQDYLARLAYEHQRLLK